MTVILVGVGADSENVKPRPRIELGRRFEYIPIPEKSIETTESQSFGSIELQHTEAVLSDRIDKIKPHKNADWVDKQSKIEEWPVHYDPNFETLTYGEGGKDPNINAIEELEEGDILGFYTGLDTHGKMHRYIFGYFTVDQKPHVITENTSQETKRKIFDEQENNAHAKRFAANGELYAFDPDKPEGASRVAIVPGREPGELLERAVQLSDQVKSRQFYMSEKIENKLNPSTTNLGGFKNSIKCDISSTEFINFIESHQ